MEAIFFQVLSNRKVHSPLHQREFSCNSHFAFICVFILVFRFFVFFLPFASRSMRVHAVRGVPTPSYLSPDLNRPDVATAGPPPCSLTDGVRAPACPRPQPHRPATAPPGLHAICNRRGNYFSEFSPLHSTFSNDFISSLVLIS